MDVSSLGLQIRTNRPEGVGTNLYLEIHPRASGDSSRLMLVRGNVARVVDLGNGRFAMGVRMCVEVDGRKRRPRTLTQTRAREWVDATAHQLRTLDFRSSEPVVLTGHILSDGPRKVLFRAARERPQRRRCVRAAMLLSLLVVACLVWFAMSHGTRHPRDGTLSRYGVPSADVLRSAHKDVSSSGAAGAAFGAGVLFSPAQSGYVSPSAGGVPWLEGAPWQPGLPFRHTSRIAGGYSDGHAQQKGASVSAAEPDTETVRTEMSPGAVEAAREMLFPAERPSVAWRRAPSTAVSFPKGSVSTAEEARSVAPPQLDLPLERQKIPDNVQAALAETVSLPEALSIEADVGEGSAPAGIWLEVDKGRHVLTLFRDNTALDRFLVGLGRDGATPEGRYRIVNKITNPDWYDRGRTVKADDPANPLGKRWMGLADSRGPTPYGVHATPEPDSIGQSTSRGCIRMRPEDADTLFRLCPIGTPVFIVGPSKKQDRSP